MPNEKCPPGGETRPNIYLILFVLIHFPANVNAYKNSISMNEHFGYRLFHRSPIEASMKTNTFDISIHHRPFKIDKRRAIFLESSVHAICTENESNYYYFSFPFLFHFRLSGASIGDSCDRVKKLSNCTVCHSSWFPLASLLFASRLLFELKKQQCDYTKSTPNSINTRHSHIQIKMELISFSVEMVERHSIHEMCHCFLVSFSTNVDEK